MVEWKLIPEWEPEPTKLGKIQYQAIHPVFSICYEIYKVFKAQPCLSEKFCPHYNLHIENCLDTCHSIKMTFSKHFIFNHLESTGCFNSNFSQTSVSMSDLENARIVSFMILKIHDNCKNITTNVICNIALLRQIWIKSKHSID